MKKIIFLIFCISVLVSCKNDKNSEQTEDTNLNGNIEKTEKQSDGLTLLKGEFVYYGGAAVLQTQSEIYGVFITDKMLELNELAEKFKTQPTDMVQVEVRGKITTQNDEKILWDNKLEIEEILNVFAPKSKDDIIKLGKE
ncbi:hypothetical protein [Litoribaculum gwangyangense]|uniref:NlpE C-terminal OB domain-containing protein n=1 Tax=Litoribaculum gwangyangense TaxID=1130722 RepID=A0ABP9C358_9FLAO